MSVNIDLTGKLALITGATGQLGRAITGTLARAGADVIIHYHHNQTKAQELSKDVEKLGRQSLCVSGPVHDLDTVGAWHGQIQDKWQRLPDIVISCAVEQIFPWQSVIEESIDDYLSQFQSCALQHVCLAKVFAPPMIEKNYGRFIGINTEAAMQLQETQSAYGAGKRAMDGVMRVLAKEVGRYNITVNQIAPGWTISDKDREQGTEYQPDYSNNVPMKRRGTDQDIANAALFLASDLAAYITGAFIPVCGGNVMPTI